MLMLVNLQYLTRVESAQTISLKSLHICVNYPTNNIAVGWLILDIWHLVWLHLSIYTPNLFLSILVEYHLIYQRRKNLLLTRKENMIVDHFHEQNITKKRLYPKRKASKQQSSIKNKNLPKTQQIKTISF